MKKLHGYVVVPFAAAVLSLGLGACSTPGPTTVGAANSGLRASAPMIYVQSARQTDDITSCLEDYAGSLRAANAGSAVELGDGHDWLITLTPARGGSTVEVQKAVNASERIPEPEMRFDIARCTT